MKLNLIAISLCALTISAAIAQQPTSSNGSQVNQVPLSGRTGQNGSVAAQQSAVPGTTQSVDTLNSTVSVQGPYAQSILSGRSIVGPLSLREAVQLGLDYNLGIVGQTNATLQAHGQMRVARSALLPNVSGSLREVLQKTNLAAQGLRTNVFPTIVGPYNYFDLRAQLTQNVLDLTALNNYRSAQENVTATKMAAKDSRDLVVLAVAGAYLEAVAAEARVDSAKAQAESAKAVYEQTKQRRDAGLNAQIDVNRDLVEYQTQQQRITTLQNDFAKQKINLARIIGLSPLSELILADKVPYVPGPTLTIEDGLKAALATRADLKEADAAARSAQRAHTAALAERIPALSVSGDYGSIGVNPAQAYGTYSVTGTLRVPIWLGGKTEGDIEQSKASLNQRRAERSEVEGRIQSDVKNAFLDLEAATSQLQVAESNRKVARENLDLTRQRLESGIADSVEVTQAQETVASSELDAITSLLSFNLAKLSLARAIGDSEAKISLYLGLP
jgi:outer membrane protein TolC